MTRRATCSPASGRLHGRQPSQPPALPSSQRRRELDDVVVVVLEEAEAAVDRLEVDGVAEDLDAAGPKLGERRVDVGDVEAEVVVLLDAEALVERVDRGVGLGRGAAEDLDLGGA